MLRNSIVTVGICPCWDRTYYIDGIEWGQHETIKSQSCVPAGKALNISKALSGLGVGCKAAGLWGQSDSPQMLHYLSQNYPHIKPRFSVVLGQTRTNVTIVDIRNKRDLHLRAQCQLVTKDSLKQLRSDLATMTSASMVVFSGSMPETFMPEIVSIMEMFRSSGTRLIVDTSGPALEAIVKQGTAYLIKPNFQELCQLLGRNIDNQVDSIIQEARSLCDLVSVILISRGADGALLVTQKEAMECKVKDNVQQQTINTVGCGDYLLAGFLSQVDSDDPAKALLTGVKVAAARAWGLTETTDWNQTIDSFEIDIRKC